MIQTKKILQKYKNSNVNLGNINKSNKNWKLLLKKLQITKMKIWVVFHEPVFAFFKKLNLWATTTILMSSTKKNLSMKKRL